MDFTEFSFRNADAVLGPRYGAWPELRRVIESITMERVIATQELIASAGRRPRGGQRAINQIFREELTPLGWTPEPLLFPAEDRELRNWKMDFLKDGIGVEVSFNHAEAIAWTFTRLNLAGESPRVLPDHRIDVGVAIFATKSLKAWARMDAAVSTYETARAWLREMKPILPIPIMVIGLEKGPWPKVPLAVFPGTKKR